MRADRDAIAAIATAPGRGGIGVVRVSGRGLAALAAAITGRELAPRRATRSGFLAADGAAIDDGMALWFPAPGSYTGEDVLELHGHGGEVVQQLILRRCLELGARPAQPGEFTYRAYLNDKLDLAQAEGVADLIEAATETAARAALASLRGEFSATITALAGRLVETRALVEATLDFPEEEIDAADRVRAAGRLSDLRAELARILELARQGNLLRTGLQVVIAGQPNVGKSSLLNRLSGRDAAIVTDIPGTTRDSIREAIQIEGVPIHVVDTAGLREATDAVEAIGIGRAWEAAAAADLVLLLVDARSGVTAADRAIAARLGPESKVLTVYNKCDLVFEVPDCADGPRISAVTGQGMDELKRALLAQAGWRPSGEGLVMARARHVDALERAQANLARAAGVTGELELFAEELRLAHEALSSITGEYSADDLLGEIFSRFCIGK